MDRDARRGLGARRWGGDWPCACGIALFGSRLHRGYCPTHGWPPDLDLREARLGGLA